MTDEQFREEHAPLHVPAHFEDAQNLKEQVTYALAQLDTASADEVARKLGQLRGEGQDKLLIADVHRLLTELYNNGLIAGRDDNGGLKYNLHKVTEANDGSVNPNLLAPGLD